MEVAMRADAAAQTAAVEAERVQQEIGPNSSLLDTAKQRRKVHRTRAAQLVEALQPQGRD
jgi:hypothetical protein